MQENNELLTQFNKLLNEFSEVSTALKEVDFSNANPISTAAYIMAMSELTRAIQKVNAAGKVLVIQDSIRKMKDENED